MWPVENDSQLTAQLSVVSCFVLCDFLCCVVPRTGYFNNMPILDLAPI